MVEVLNQLHTGSELINFSLHQLLWTRNDKGELVFNPPALHNFLPLLNLLLLSLFNNLPHLIRENINSLMELLFRCFILPQVRVLVTEIIEFFDKGLQFVLLDVWTVQVCQELFLDCWELLSDSFPLASDLWESLFHLSFIVLAELRPHLHEDGFDVAIHVREVWGFWSYLFCCWFWFRDFRYLVFRLSLLSLTFLISGTFFFLLLLFSLSILFLLHFPSFNFIFYPLKARLYSVS